MLEMLLDMLGEIHSKVFGALCIIGIVLCWRRITEERRTVTFSKLVCSFCIGLFFGVASVAIFSIFFIFTFDTLKWVANSPYVIRMYMLALYLLFAGFCGGKLGAFLFKKYLPGKIIIPSALIAALLLIFQPFGYKILQVIGLVP